jgi:hypothetical protein
MTITPVPADLDSVALTMADFGNTGYCTIDPKIQGYEEIISFTGLTANGDGTATLTGLTRDLQSKYPYTGSGTGKLHGASAIVVFSNNPQIYGRLAGKDNDETISGAWTFTPAVIAAAVPTLSTHLVNKAYADALAIAGSPNASTSAKGIVQEATLAQVLARTAAGSTGAELYINPVQLPNTLISDYVADTGTADVYAIAPTPAITAYVTGQMFSFKASATNTTASTLNVNGLGTKNIFLGGAALIGGEILINTIVQVEYDGTQFNLTSVPANVLTTNTSPTKLADATQLAGENLTALQAVSAGWYQTDGGVKFDAKINGAGAATSIGSPSITIGANTNRIAIIVVGAATQTIGTPTLNGVAFTQIDANATGLNSYIGYLVAPATGAQTIACSFGGSTAFSYAVYSYYNAKQTGEPDAHTIVAQSTNTGTTTTTPVLAGTLLFGWFMQYGTGAQSDIGAPAGAGNNRIYSSAGVNNFCTSTGDNGIDPTIDAQIVSFSSGTQPTQLGALTIAPVTAPSYGYVVKSSAANGSSYASPLATTSRINFLGFVTNSPTATQAATIQIAGVMTGLSGLSPMKTCYLSNTLGTISTTAGTNSRKVGIALTATTMLITNTP